MAENLIREQEREALDLALMGITACLERLPELSGWRPSMTEARAALASTVRGNEEA